MAWVARKQVVAGLGGRRGGGSLSRSSPETWQCERGAAVGQGAQGACQPVDTKWTERGGSLSRSSPETWQCERGAAVGQGAQGACQPVDTKWTEIFTLIFIVGKNVPQRREEAPANSRCWRW